MTSDIRFGDYLICIRSSCGNEGKIVKVIDKAFDPARPEYVDWLFHPKADIVVETCGGDLQMRLESVSENGEVIEEIYEGTQAAVRSCHYSRLDGS